MKVLNTWNRISTYFAFLLCSMSVSATSIFSDESINVWVVNPDNQAVTSYSVGQWVTDYNDLQGFAPNAPYQVLVNGLPNSSIPMSPMQAGVSIIGLGEADVESGTYSGTAPLYLLPASQSSTNTIEVVMQVDAQLAQQSPVELMWQINGGAVNTYSVETDQDINSNGLYSKRFYLVADGTYEVEVSLSQAGQVLNEKRATYSIVSDDPLKEKRDSDGDGVPDLIEAQIGFDPTNSELFEDTDGDGWSDFDLWLRCADIALENCGIPNDTDGDGWSDFDENLRGTKHNDFVLPLGNADENDETYIKNRRLLQEKPAARRLYEVEYTLSGNLGDSKFTHIEAAELDGTGLFQVDELVNEQDLVNLGVNASALAPNILQATARANMQSAQWPSLRLAASKTLAIRANKSLADDGEVQNPSQAISLLILDGAGDVSIQNFPNTLNGQWDSAVQWRNLLKDWLKTQVVVSKQVPFSALSSQAGLLLEASLREEALFLGADETVLLGKARFPATWINKLQSAMIASEQQDLFAWYTRIADNLSNNMSYGNLFASVNSIIEQMPVSGTNTSEWLIERLRMPVILSDQGCFISSTDLATIQADQDYYAIYLESCPVFYTELELAQWHAQASASRYLLRMTMYVAGASQITQSASLAQFDEDTDNDGLSNLAETLQARYELSSYPWLEDTDGDGLSDSVDECRNDSLNLCAGNPIDAEIRLGSDLQISVNNQGGIAFLELVLTAPALQEISFTYYIEAAQDQGDTALDGIDFNAMTGTLHILPGQQSILIPVALLANELPADIRFRMRVEDLIGANFVANTGNTQLVNVSRVIGNSPNIILAANSYSINERAQVSFDASSSSSGVSDPVMSFLWTQIAGPSAVITGSNTNEPSITAPNTTTPVELRFNVSAQNTSGGQASASVSVLVNPVDDPPVVNGTANYTVARTDSLSISKEDLLALVSEPDGETLTITQIIQGITQGGTLSETSNSFEFAPSITSGPVVTRLDNNPLDTRPWINNGIAYRTADQTVSPSVYKIHTWTPQEGSQVVAENTTGYSDLLVNVEQEIIYYSRSNADTGTTWIEWRNADNSYGAIDTGGYASLFGAQIDASNGALYHCIDSQWERINPQTASAERIDLECSRFGAAQAIINDKFCLSGEDGLYCSENGFVFEQVFELPVSYATIDRVFSSAAGTLVLYNDSTNQFIAHIDGQTNGQLLHTLDNYFNFIQGYWINETFYTILPVKRSAFDEGVQLFKWQAQDTQLVPLGTPDLFSEQFIRSDFYNFVPLGSNFVWSGQKTFTAHAKYLINSQTGEFTQAGDDLSGSRTLHAFKGGALFSSEQLESSCEWYVLDETGLIGDSSSPELEQASCFGRLVYGDTLAYTYFNSSEGFNEFYAKYGSRGVSQTQFVVRIEDENGNGVELTVNINITEGAQ